MGAVYEATELEGGARRALKVMSAKLHGNKKALHRFEREARLGKMIPSRGVAHTLATGVDPRTNLRWIAMEFIEGPTLVQWLAQTQPSPESVRSVIQQLLRAVAAAHSVGVVHRDLKPGNILIAEAAPGAANAAEPGVKVLDFGIAKSIRSNTGATTQEGLGTPLWTAPEQGVAGHAPAPSADVWALGLLVFYLLTGKYYWLSANREGPLAEMVIELMRRPIAAASKRAAELDCAERVPPGFDAWFARCVVRDPHRRFTNAGEALDGLARVLGLKARRSGVWARLRTLRRLAALRPGMGVAVLAVALTIALAAAWLLAHLR